MTWLLNEDAAIKQKLSGLTVSDENAPPSGRQVAVRFRLPETELADITFPLIVIEHAGISKADDREHRGQTILPYIPEEETVTSYQVRDRHPETWEPTGALIDWDPQADPDVRLSPIHVPDYPIPYNLDYQITVYARKQNHLMELAVKLAEIDRIPSRFGYLEVGDGTIRTLDLMGSAQIAPEKDRDGKRIFRAVYSVRVVSELNLYDYTVTGQPVEEVDLTVIHNPESLG